MSKRSSKSFVKLQNSGGPKPHLKPSTADISTTDSFNNFLTKTGVGTPNLASGGRYGFNPISRNRLLLEWAYRGSWIVGQVVDCIAEDMTREGMEIVSDDEPDAISDLDDDLLEKGVWESLQDTIKWARLYGGALGYMSVDGQDSATPLDVKSIGQDQFLGVIALDRWALFPDMTQLIEKPGPDLGNPMYYELRPDAQTGLSAMRIHYSRCIRMEGVKLPYWQKITENYWGQSVIERLYDRLLAFDSTTEGAAQMVYKAHLRTYAIKDLRKIIGLGGAGYDALVKQIQMIRAFQSNEGITLMDAEDKFEIHQYAFAGLDTLLEQFGQQLSGASQIPLVRLFGQSPGGLNSTGESDLRTYYDGIKRQQNRIKPRLRVLYELAYRSKFGKEPGRDYKQVFLPLWQMSDKDKSDTAATNTATVLDAVEKNVVPRSTAMKELKAQSKTTGIWTNITDQMITNAVAEDNEEPPTPEEIAANAAAGSGLDGPKEANPKPPPNAGRSPAKPGAAGGKTGSG